MPVINWIKNNDFVLNVSKLVTGTVAGQVITLLVSPILTRLYSSDDFGILAIYFSVASILSVIITLRFDMAIVLPQEEDESIDLVLLGLIVAFVLSISLLVVFILFRTNIVNLIGHPELSVYLYLVPISTFFYGSYQVLSYWNSRVKEFNRLAISKTVKEISTALIQLSMGTLYYTGALGLVLGQIAGNFGAANYLLIKVFFRLKSRITSGIWINLKSVFQKYKKFPLYTSWTSLVSAISQNIPAILLAFLFSPAIAGFYAVATRVMTMPSILIGNSVRQVYYQKASILNNQNKSILNIYTKTTLSLSLIAVAPMSVIMIWGEPLFRFIFGPTWGEAGIFASILTIWLFFSFMNPPSTVTVLILGLNRLQLLLESLLLVFRVIAILAGYLIYNDIIISLFFFSFVGSIYQISFMTYIYFRLKYSE
jgi:O-antigen/teichoic acid export membrane protein